MTDKQISLSISIIFLFIGYFLNNSLIESSTVYKNEKESLAESLNYRSRFLDKEEWQQLEEKNELSLGYSDRRVGVTLAYGNSMAQKQLYQQQQQKIKQAQVSVQTKSYQVLLLIIIYLVIMIVLFLTIKPAMLPLVSILSISIVCLHAGLLTPMLEIGAIERDFNLADIAIEKKVMGVTFDITVQKKFEGDVYFYYQSKSIVELITLLFQQNNLVVGFSILIFSVIFPFLKTSLMAFFVIKPNIINKKWFTSLVLNISKWSMADVFVVAIFLGFLAFKDLQVGVGTYSNTSIGLYFFLAYCLLSILSSMLIKVNKK